MNRSLLVNIFGFPATLIHGDPMVMDRWRWLNGHLSDNNSNAKLLDIGCGNGFFLEGLTKIGINNVYGVEPSSEMALQPLIILK